MNNKKLCILTALIANYISYLFASDTCVSLLPSKSQTHATSICFKSADGQAKTLSINNTASIGIVYRQIAIAFNWRTLPLIYCHHQTRCIPLALDCTDNFLECLGIPQQEKHILSITQDFECP